MELNTFRDVFNSLSLTYTFMRTPNTSGIDVRPITGKTV